MNTWGGSVIHLKQTSIMTWALDFQFKFRTVCSKLIGVAMPVCVSCEMQFNQQVVRKHHQMLETRYSFCS